MMEKIIEMPQELLCRESQSNEREMIMRCYTKYDLISIYVQDYPEWFQGRLRRIYARFRDEEFAEFTHSKLVRKGLFAFHANLISNN